MFVPLRDAAKHYNVCKQSIAAWAERGDIEFIELPSGHKRYRINGSGNTTLQSPPSEKKEKVNICYCRVSSNGQKEDLKRQIEYMRERYPGYEIYSDVGSGLNWKRQGLRAVLRRCLQGDVEKVAVAHKDRLARFGFEILEFMLAQCGIQLLCDHQDVHKSKESELVEDILSIVTVFSARIHGQRSYNSNKKNRVEAIPGSSDKAEEMDGVL
jgi:predicted site-specific integrase-resolvase